MPSPLAHGAAAYLIFRRLAPTAPELEDTPWPALSTWGLAAGLGFLSLLPDLDIVPALIFGDMEGYHNQGTHSFVAGLVAAPLVGALAWGIGRWRFWRWTGIALVAYLIHLVMDYFTVGRGLMLLWPFDPQRYSAPMHLFYGVRWADGWLAPVHGWMLLNEVAWVLLVLIAAHLRPERS